MKNESNSDDVVDLIVAFFWVVLSLVFLMEEYASSSQSMNSILAVGSK
jgi:hypothetical protein